MMRLKRQAFGFPRQRKPAPAKRGEAGFSLIEGLMAAGLLLIIAISILPIFTRALESNVSGSRSSQMSTFVSADLEEVNQLTVDRDEWEVAASGGVRTLAPMYWDTGPLFGTAGIPDMLGDEQWIADETAAQGLVIWSRNVSVRKYSLSDLQILAGTDVSDDIIVAAGHPMLLDTPLDDDESAHLTEVRVSIIENRESMPAGAGRRITVNHVRAF